MGFEFGLGWALGVVFGLGNSLGLGKRVIERVWF